MKEPRPIENETLTIENVALPIDGDALFAGNDAPLVGTDALFAGNDAPLVEKQPVEQKNALLLKKTSPFPIAIDEGPSNEDALVRSKNRADKRT
ncbi:MAG: hypothetical protein M3O50_11670 [Myxococcota bacterium]|nr:hypothetical protein [Myxococcota bacterium]